MCNIKSDVLRYFALIYHYSAIYSLIFKKGATGKTLHDHQATSHRGWFKGRRTKINDNIQRGQKFLIIEMLYDANGGAKNRLLDSSCLLPIFSEDKWKFFLGGGMGRIL